MTSRRTLVIDRVAAFVLSALLLGGGLVALWWWTGTDRLPDRADTAPVAGWVDSDWWPWATGALGVVLVLVGLRWLSAHVSRRGVPRLHLRGSGPRGRLVVDASSLADAAAEVLADTLGVRSVNGGVLHERRETIIRLRATIAPEADLARIASRADHVAAQLGHALKRPDVRCKVELRVAAPERQLRRTR